MAIQHQQPLQYTHVDVRIVDDEIGISTSKRKHIIAMIKKQERKNLKRMQNLFTAVLTGQDSFSGASTQDAPDIPNRQSYGGDKCLAGVGIYPIDRDFV